MLSTSLKKANPLASSTVTKSLKLDDGVQDDYLATFSVENLTNNRTIIIPDRNFTMSKSEDLSGSVLPSNIINSSLQSLGSQSQDLDLNNHKIINLATPTLSTDAANKSYVDVQLSNVVAASGGTTAGTITGDTLNSSVIYSSLTSLGAQSEALDMNGKQIQNLFRPTASNHASTKQYVDDTVDAATVAIQNYYGNSTTLASRIINSSLQNLGLQNSNLNMNSNKIINLLAPASDNDASTKKYVDDKVAASTPSASTLTGTVLNSTIVTSSLTSLGLQNSNLNMNSNKIINLLAPASDNDASTKKYVDDKFATVSAPSASSITGDTLNSTVINSNIQKLGQQMQHLNMNGFQILNVNKISSTNTSHNYSYGKDSNYSLTSGSYNNSMGFLSLALATSGSYNVAIGNQTLYSNLGSYNTSIGAQSMLYIQDANNNTCLGYNSAFTNYVVENPVTNNTIIGAYGLVDNIPEIGFNNAVALGYSAGSGLTPKDYDLIIGSGNKNNQLIQGSFNSSNRHFSPAATSKVDLGQKNQRWKNTYSDKVKVNKFRVSYNIPDLWAIYDFNDNSRLGYDYSGNQRDIICSGAIYSPSHTYTISAVNYTKDNLIYFNQTSDNQDFNQRLDLSNVYPELKTSMNITISFWIFPTVTSSSKQTLISFSYSPNNTSYFNMGISPTTNYLYINSNLFSAETMTALTMNNYNHIVYSLGSSGTSIYLNNVNILSNSTPIQLSTFDFDSFTFGCYKGFNSTTSANYQLPLFNAYVQTLSIWSKTLNATEILNLYNNDYGSEVIPLFGQSQTAGRGSLVQGIDNLTNTRINQYPFSVNVNSFGEAVGSTISIASNPLDHQDTDATNTMGLWYSFCTTILPYIGLRRKILLVPAAWSGKGFVTGEFVRTGLGYIGMKNATLKALSLNQWNRLNCYIMWQGETDSGSSWKYYGYISDFYNNLVSDIGMNTNIPYIFATIKEESNGKMLLNRVLRSFEDEDNGRYLVECSGFDTNADGVHFNNTSLRDIGRLFAQKYLKHYYNSSFDTTLTVSDLNITSPSYKISRYGGSTIYYNGANSVYLQVSLTLEENTTWLLCYTGTNLWIYQNSPLSVFISTLDSTNTNANIKSAMVTYSQSTMKGTGGTGTTTYFTTSNQIIVTPTATTTYYLYGCSNTAPPTTTDTLYSSGMSGGLTDPDGYIQLFALKIR